MSLNPFVCSPSATSGADAVRSSSASSLQREKQTNIFFTFRAATAANPPKYCCQENLDDRWTVLKYERKFHFAPLDGSRASETQTRVHACIFFPANDKRTHYISTQSVRDSFLQSKLWWCVCPVWSWAAWAEKRRERAMNPAAGRKRCCFIHESGLSCPAQRSSCDVGTEAPTDGAFHFISLPSLWSPSFPTSERSHL